MSNPSKEKGTRDETRVCRYMRLALADERIERRALHGARDMGDIRGVFAHGYEGIAEVKAHKHRTPAKLREWKAQTLAERGNADADFAALVVKVPNRPVSEYLVYLTDRDMLRSCWGMDFGCADELDETWSVKRLGEWCALLGGGIDE